MTRLLQTYVLLITCFLLAGCTWDDPWARGYVDGYAPIYSNDPALKKISYLPPRKTVNGGKIYTAGTIVLQEEPDAGLHVFSYQDPAHPVKTGFISIPGFQVATVEGDYLYASNYNDLVAIPLKALAANMTVGRVSSIWTQKSFPKAEPRSYFECVDPKKGAVVGWRKTRVRDPQCRTGDNPDGAPVSGTGERSNPGLTVINANLYVIANDRMISVYSIQLPGAPIIKQNIDLFVQGVDSIYNFNDKLVLSYGSDIEIYESSTIRRERLIWDLFSCGKGIITGDRVYVFPTDPAACYNGTGIIQYDISKDTTAGIQVAYEPVGHANTFALSGNYIYGSTEEGIIMINISGPRPVKENIVSREAYSEIAVQGDLLFAWGLQGMACYNIASPATPTLISKLAN